jgi:pSer/pThr/pTyr-binding forkhead associated (FHA) protein
LLEYQSSSSVANKKRSIAADPTVEGIVARASSVVNNIEQGSRVHLQNRTSIALRSRYIEIVLERGMPCEAKHQLLLVALTH